MDLRPLDLRHLRYFQAVAEAGHMTRAAAALGIQQPPLSQQIKALEQQVGMVLFHRHPKGVTLTDGGRVLLAESQRLLTDVAAMERRVRAVAEGKAGVLSVGFTSSAAAHRFTPEVLRLTRQRHPEIVLQIGENNAAELTEAVAAARLHCGLLRVPVDEPEGLVFETLLREPVVVALPLGHPLAGRSPAAAKRPLPLARLKDEAFILTRRKGAPGLYANLLALCKSQGFMPQVAHEVERMMTNLNLVAAGAGVSVVPASMMGVHAHAIAYRPLAESAQLDAPLTLVYRAADLRGPTEHFLALARGVARKRWTSP